MRAASSRVTLGCVAVLAGAGAAACERFTQPDRSTYRYEHPVLYPGLRDPDRGRRIISDVKCGACRVIRRAAPMTREPADSRLPASMNMPTQPVYSRSGG